MAKNQTEDKEPTPKERLFAAEFLIDLDAVNAARRAGYSEKTAVSQAYNILKRPHVLKIVQENMDQRAKEVGLNANWVLERLMQIVDRCMQAEEVMVYDKEQKAWVGTGEYTFDSAGANRALELLGKHLKLYTDKVEAKGFTAPELHLYLDGKKQQ